MGFVCEVKPRCTRFLHVPTRTRGEVLRKPPKSITVFITAFITVYYGYYRISITDITDIFDITELRVKTEKKLKTHQTHSKPVQTWQI